jgi:hypothetical protein
MMIVGTRTMRRCCTGTGRACQNQNDEIDEADVLYNDALELARSLAEAEA